MAPPALASEPVKVWVRLADKGPRSAAIPHTARGYEDLPVFDPYIDSLEAHGFQCDTRLKWQNRVSGWTVAEAFPQLRALPFVLEVSLLPRKAKPGLPLPKSGELWPPVGLGKGKGIGIGLDNGIGLKKSAALSIDYGAAKALMESLQVDKLHAWIVHSGRKPGHGLRIAIIDAEFHLGSPVFQDLFKQNKIRDQWDFVSKQPVAVYQDLSPESHGAECLSLIGGNLPGTLVGVAPDAEFLLYRSEENAHEGFVEEDYVAAAIERAVDSGAQVINISLGYRYEYDDGNADLPYSVLDGKTRPSSLAATGAARRNVVVSVSVGNIPGPDHFPTTPTLSAPADADSILAVGIADLHREHCGYSCTGPSADGRVKPDVASLGLFSGCTVAVGNSGDGAGAVNLFGGTSFAAPVVAGIAGLLRQVHPELSAESIRQALITTADRFLHPDSAMGYGVVDAWAALESIDIGARARISQSESFRIYHPGGMDPLFLPWDFLNPVPEFELFEITGSRIPVTVRIFGSTLLIQPRQDLRTGVYLLRTR